MKTMSLLAVSLSSLLAGSAAYADDSDSLETTTGFDHHVAKPIEPTELIALLLNFVRQPARA